MLDEDKIAARIHGIYISDSSDDNSSVDSNSETDDEFEALRPPPLRLRDIEDIVNVPAFTFVSYKKNRRNKKSNNVNKNFNNVASSSRDKGKSKIVKNKQNICTNVNEKNKVMTRFVKAKDDIEDIVNVPAFTFVSYKKNRRNKKSNNVNKNFNNVASSSHDKGKSKIVNNKQNICTNVNEKNKVMTRFVKAKDRQKVLSSQLCNAQQPVANLTSTYANIVKSNINDSSALQSSRPVSTNQETDIKTNVKRKKRKNKKKMSNNLSNANTTENNSVTLTTTANRNK